jgi:hypothetical protein
MTNYEAGVMKVFMGAGAPGGRFDCAQDKALLEYLPQWTVCAKALEDARPPYDAANVHTAEAISTIQNNLDNLWLNKVSLDEAVATTHKLLQDVLDRPML